MKRIRVPHIVLFALFFISVDSNAQPVRKPAEPVVTVAEFEVQQVAVYGNAARYYDYNTAVMALHQIIAVQKQENSPWRDTLLQVYSKMGNFLSCHLLAEELRRARPNDNTILSKDAEALLRLGLLSEAATAYELLYNRVKSPNDGYELANIQYRLKRFAEATTTIDRILAGKIEDTNQVSFALENIEQKVPLKAALYNLKGLVLFELQDRDAAKRSFEQAVEVMPDFKAAKQNVLALSIPPSGETAPAEVPDEKN